METLQTIATLLPLALSSGLNLYATILVAGLSIHFQWVQNTPPTLDVLGTLPIIIIAGIFYLLEALADKIPFIDNLWDIIHTVVRPLGAAMIGVIALGNANATVVVITVLAVGSITLVTHGGKAGSRLALNLVTPFENLTNIGISMAEDVFAAILTVLALKYPYLASSIALIVFVLIVIYMPQLFRWSWFTVQSFFAWVKSLFKKETNSDRLPLSHQLLLNRRNPEITSRCKGQNIKGANGRTGFASVLDNNLYFTYDTLFGSRIWNIDLKQILTTYFHPRGLIDVLEIHHYDEKQKEHITRFAFLKDRRPLAELLEARIKPLSSAQRLEVAERTSRSVGVGAVQANRTFRVIEPNSGIGVGGQSSPQRKFQVLNEDTSRDSTESDSNEHLT